LTVTDFIFLNCFLHLFQYVFGPFFQATWKSPRLGGAHGVLGLAHHSHHFGLIRTDHVTFRRLMFMFVVSITRNTTALRFHCPSERQALDLRQPTRPTPFGDESLIQTHNGSFFSRNSRAMSLAINLRFRVSQSSAKFLGSKDISF